MTVIGGVVVVVIVVVVVVGNERHFDLSEIKIFLPI